jgi:hypothetical protein
MKRFVLCWLASLVLVAMASMAFAQRGPRLPEPRVLSGEDIGFRVEGIDPSGKPMGTLVIRVNGNWVEIGSSMGPRPAK